MQVERTLNSLDYTIRSIEDVINYSDYLLFKKCGIHCKNVGIDDDVIDDLLLEDMEKLREKVDQ